MNELVRIENILALLRRGKYELTGEEILAFNQCFEYLLNKRSELKNPGPSAVATPVVVAAPALVNPIKSTRAKKNGATK